MPIAMSTFDSSKEGLQDLLNDIRDGKVQLPDFQRDWRWDDDHIRSLLASVSLSYPIGAILLMETGGPDGRFAPRLLEGVNLDPRPEPQRLVLDGQQRLTALYQVLKSGQAVTTRDNKGKTIHRWYYLDIKKALDPTVDREDAIISVPEDRRIVSFQGQVLNDYSTTERECSAGLLPLTLIYDIGRLFQWLDGYTNSPSATTQHQRTELRNQIAAEVISRFQQYQIPVIELRRETPKEAVCQVFEKVNTGGVALTVFELVTATFASDNYSLRDDWSQREHQLKQYSPLTGVSSSDFLTAATLLSTWMQQRRDGKTAVSCKRKDILKLTLAEYREIAEPLTRAFKEVARFLVRQKVYRASDVPYQTQLIPLAAIFAALGAQAEHDFTKQLLARWYWCGVMGELYGSAIESRFARDLAEVVDWVHGGSEPSTVTESNFVPQRLLTLRTRISAAYKGLYALLMREGALDLRTGDPIDVHTYFDDNVDIHHVFPRKVCVEQGISPRVYDSIVNKTPLSARTNRIVGGNPPGVYLERLERNGNVTKSRMDSILRSHLIDPTPLRSGQFSTFFRSRQEALLVLIEQATGKEILRSNTPMDLDAVDQTGEQ